MNLTVLLCMWQGWCPIYTVEHVNALSRQLKAYLKLPHRIVLLTDEDATGAEVDEVRAGLQEIPGLKPIQRYNCFRRLRLYDPEYTAQFGTDWLLLLDIDTLIRRDITDLIAESMTDYGLAIIRGKHAHEKRARPYNGALQLIRHGAHPEVWRDFDPAESPREIAERKWVGSDQCWIALKAPGAVTLGPEHGVYFFQQYCEARKAKHFDARILSYAGRDKPWSKSTRFQARDIWQEYQGWANPKTTSGSTSSQSGAIPRMA